MKLADFKKKFVCILLAITFTLQSCTVYKKTAVTLDEAENANLKTLVVTTDNTKHKYSRILKIDDNYYGEKKTKGKIEKILLSETEIKNIRLLDKTATTIGNIAIISGTLGIFILIPGFIDLYNFANN